MPHHLRKRLHIGAKRVAVVYFYGVGANVFLVNDQNYKRYRRGDNFYYYGGHFTGSPVVIRPPTPGAWNVVVDLGGAAGTISASVTTRSAHGGEDADETFSSEDDE